MHMMESANRWNDRIAENLRKLQVNDGNPLDIGGIWSPEKGFAEPASSARMADVFLAAYYSPHSALYGQPHMLEAAKLAMEHIHLNTHEDGTIDLMETNFHDATCNAFCTQVLAYTYRMMQKLSQHTRLEDTIEALLLTFLKDSARAMVNGGFHTPNHRWVLASALCLCYKELGLEDCRTMMFAYLDEGIDCDEEGEYTERSVGIYDIACNQSLLILCREMDMGELIEPVLRNLDKLTYYIEPDGTVATLNSRRQDFGKKLYPYPQLLNCLFTLAAPHDKADERYRRVMGLCEYLYTQYLEREENIVLPADAGQFVTQFLLNPVLAACEHPAIPLRMEYQRFFERSGVVRIRKGKAALTLVRERSVFCKLQVGKLEMLLRAGACFYACGQFISRQIEEIEGGYRLHSESTWGYVRPLGKRAGSTVWEEIPHDQREKVNMLTLEWTLDVLVCNDRIELNVNIGGCDRLPWKLEAIFTPGGVLDARDGEIAAGAGNTVILENSFQYQLGDDGILWSNGLKQHLYTTAMRNTPPNEEKAFTVYNTGFAPYQYTVTITW